VNFEICGLFFQKFWVSGKTFGVDCVFISTIWMVTRGWLMGYWGSRRMFVPCFSGEIEAYYEQETEADER